MSGICSIFSFKSSPNAQSVQDLLIKGIRTLKYRGPYGETYFYDNQYGIAQCFSSKQETRNETTLFNKRYRIGYIGTIFNLNILQNQYEIADTESLLAYLYHTFGPSFLKLLSGEFTIIIIDTVQNQIFAARDRIGIYPLVYSYHSDRILIASELKALCAMGMPKYLNHIALYQYLQLNYVPEPFSMFKDAQKLLAGHYLIASSNHIEIHQWYKMPNGEQQNYIPDYETAKQTLRQLVDTSINQRLNNISDFGTFLSGGIDSTIVTALAAQKTKQLKTFSIGYQDEPLFDETAFAEIVAQKYHTKHYVFKLSNRDFLEALYKVMEYTDEPYADSSGLALNMLAKLTKEHCPVILSGDGCDELFAGYNKHASEFKLQQGGLAVQLAALGKPVWKLLPKSRHAYISNKIRQLDKFAQGYQLPQADRYWRWCSISDENQLNQLLIQKIDRAAYLSAKQNHLQYFNDVNNFNQVLYTDMHLVMNGDMIPKVDWNTAPYNLNVYAPFLASEIVDFIVPLPYSYKITPQIRKKILKDCFAEYIPQELYNRPKHGFEIPLLKWFRNDLKDLIEDFLNPSFIKAQDLFNITEIENLKQKLISMNSGETTAQIYALIMFQNWWKKNFQ